MYDIASISRRHAKTYEFHAFMVIQATGLKYLAYIETI